MSVWLKGYSKEKNTMACFRLRISGRHKKTTLKMAATGSYKIFLDAKLIGCGPRRALMGESVVNEYDITQYIYNKNSYLTVEIIYSGTDSFYIVDEQPFFHCEIYGDGELIANEKDFESYINLNKIQKVGRYSYQRGFLENYRFDNNPYLNYLGETFGWQKCETEVVKSNVLVNVDLPYPTFEKMPFQEIEQGGVIDREDKTPVPCGKSSAFNALTVAFPDSELECDVVAELSK